MRVTTASRRFPGLSAGRWIGGLLTAVLMLAGCRGVAEDAAPQGEPKQQAAPGFMADDSVRGEYLVEVGPGAEASAVLRAAFGEFGLSAVVPLETRRRYYLIRIAQDPGPEAMSARADGIDGVESVEPNLRYSTPETVTPLDRGESR